MKDEDWTILQTLYETSNLTKASNLLFISQPALTKRLQQIEQEFDAVLAIRSTKGLIFTPQGEYLAQKAREYITLLQKTKQRMAAMRLGNLGDLKIGAPNSYARFSLPPILKRYGSLYQRVNFTVTVMHSTEIVRLVQNGAVHIGFVRGDHEHEEEQCRITSDDAWVFTNRPVRLEDLPKLQFIQHIKDPATLRLIHKWWYDHFDQPPHEDIEVGDVDTCREMVANGLGFGIFFSDYMPTSPDLYKLPMLNGDGSSVKRNTWMVYKKELYHDVLIQNFVDFIRNDYCIGKTG